VYVIDIGDHSDKTNAKGKKVSDSHDRSKSIEKNSGSAVHYNIGSASLRRLSTSSSMDAAQGSVLNAPLPADNDVIDVDYAMQQYEYHSPKFNSKMSSRSKPKHADHASS
jgi:hypothetical protein